jgi:hypothetical protein
MAYWLFYSGPENYLSAEGERNFASEIGLWSGVPGVRKGDLALLYRRSLTKVSVGQMREMTGMSLQRARVVKRRKIGSDIPVVWRIVSDDKGPFNSWSHGYDVDSGRPLNRSPPRNR